ncbi:hypothetical protein [Amorphus sp. MBR-141]
MFAKKTIILIATTFAIAGGSIGANAAPLSGAGLATTVESRAVLVKKGGGHGGHKGHHGHGAHHGGHYGPGYYGRGPGYVGFYPPRRCRIERVRVFDPYLGRRVWVKERVCFRAY